MPIRRIIALFAAALILAGAGYTAYWFHAAGVLRKGLERWADQRRAEGWTVEWDGAATSGYPLHLRLTVTAPHLVNPQGAGWRTDGVVAAVQPFNWTRLRVVAPGRHQLAWPGGGGELNAVKARAEINLYRSGALDDATLLLSGVTVTGLAPEPLKAAGLALTWDPLEVTKVDHTTPTVRFSATAHGITLPNLPGLPLDRTIGLAEITGRVLGALPEAPPREALARWSADGGTVEVDHVSLEWAPMELEGQGTLALDPAGRPLGSLTAQVRGFAPLMDRLADAGTVPANTANAAKMVLMLLSKTDSKGRPAVPVPVNIQDGNLFFGPARVAPIPFSLNGTQP
ncbi:MAG TPA: DUF2125 domain-containing protein [Magnetospirillum sp.]|jgi:hypothetical protein|nr:DUF2125 domain-containing protein [Magnetospirillum sp.]